MYSQSKSAWVENDSSVALMFTDLATAVPTGTVSKGYSSFLGTADNILIPICVDLHWSLAIVSRQDAHATIFHFDSNVKCRHLDKLNDRLPNWASANISWGSVIFDHAIVSVPCAEQNNGVSCGWHLVNNAAKALQILQTSRMPDLMKQWPRDLGRGVEPEIGRLKIMCLIQLGIAKGPVSRHPGRDSRPRMISAGKAAAPTQSSSSDAVRTPASPAPSLPRTYIPSPPESPLPRPPRLVQQIHPILSPPPSCPAPEVSDTSPRIGRAFTRSTRKAKKQVKSAHQRDINRARTALSIFHHRRDAGAPQRTVILETEDDELVPMDVVDDGDVSDDKNVDEDDIYEEDVDGEEVGKDAVVNKEAVVDEDAVVDGNDAVVDEEAVVDGNDAVVAKNALVDEDAVVDNEAVVDENAVVDNEVVVDKEGDREPVIIGFFPSTYDYFIDLVVPR
jgi:hypothetical protein